MEKSSRKPNRLVDSTSPYLLQHAYNPVDWHPWNAETLAKAKGENKPIFLSIGYSACHWCHVMEHQVFESEPIAALMNEHFVNIKVDREERPDLDDLYMLATQLMTGQGGWPMSVFLTPELKPFYAGTYFPPTDSYGRPGFPKVLTALSDAWRGNREALFAQAEKVVAAIRQHADETAGGSGGAEEIDAGPWIAAAVERHADTFDAVHGGLGTAPKFPPHQTLNLWLELMTFLPTQNASGETMGQVRGMLEKTLQGMGRGGIYDHVAGGFARYSTDEKWLVPHFEKMLYDNAQLAPVYARASRVLAEPWYAEVARGTVEFWLRDMTGPAGEFYSTLDADSEGEEGKFYVWTTEEIREAFPNVEDQKLIIKYFAMKEEGNWHESPVEKGNVLAISGIENREGRIEKLVAEMRRIRASRAWPGLDDKVLTSWNALFISALAVCGRVLGEPGYVEAGRKGLAYLERVHVRGGELLRVSRKGAAHTAGFLDDYAYLLAAVLDVHEATGDAGLIEKARGLADQVIEKFEDRERGGFFFTAAGHEQLFTRMKNAADNATPSPAGVAIHGLLKLSMLTGDDKYAEAAQRAMGAFATHIGRRPDFFPTILAALLSTQREPAESKTPISPPSVKQQSGTAILAFGEIPEVELHEGQTIAIPIRVTIAPPYHVQPASDPQPGMHATQLNLRTDLSLAADVRYPRPTLTEDQFPAYAGEMEIIVECSLQEPASLGRYTLRATLLAQPCSSTHCLEPQAISIDIPISVS